MLGRGLHHDSALGRQREGRLPLEVEMLLPAHVEAALDDARSFCNRRRRVALRPGHRPALEAAARVERLIDRQDRGQFAVVDPALARRPPCREVAFGHDQEDRLADIMHRPRRQQGLVMDRGRDIVGVGQILRRPDRDHPRRGADLRKIDRRDLAMRDRRQPEGQVQRVGGQRHVVDIPCAAGDVQRPGIVGQGFRDAHASTSSTETWRPSRSWKCRSSMFCAASSR